MKIRCVNEAMEKALETVLCPPCGGPHGKEEQLCNLQKLRTKNVILKTEVCVYANTYPKNYIFFLLININFMSSYVTK